MNNTTFPYQLVCVLVVLSLALTFSACSRIHVDLKPGDILESQRHKQAKESLQGAMDRFAKGAYSEAKAQFMHLGNKTSYPKIKEQARLGAVLSDILSAECLSDIQGPENELEELIEQSSPDMGMDMRFVRPFVQILREHIVIKEENQTMHKKLQTAQSKIQSLKQEKKDLTGQIQELEELFKLIEEQKSRQLLNSQ